MSVILASDDVRALWAGHACLEVVHSKQFRPIPDREAPPCVRCGQRTKILLMDVELNGGDWLLRGNALEYCLRCDQFSFAEKSYEAMVESIRSYLDGDGPLQISVLRFLPRHHPIYEQRPTIGTSRSSCAECSGELHRQIVDLSVGGEDYLVAPAVEIWSCTACKAMDAQEVYQRLLERASGRWEITSIRSSEEFLRTPHPTEIYVEPTTRCNLKCTYCSNPLLPERNTMSMAVLEEIVAKHDARWLSAAHVMGLGEPFLHKQLFDMCRVLLAANPDMYIAVVTNGMLLADDAVYERICSSGISLLSISIDTMDEAQQAEIRQGINLARVIKNLDAFLAYKKRHGLKLPDVDINTTVLRETLGGMPQMVQFCADRGLLPPQLIWMDNRPPIRRAYSQRMLRNRITTSIPRWIAINKRERAEWERITGKPSSPTASFNLEVTPFEKGANWYTNCCTYPINGALSFRANGDILLCSNHYWDIEPPSRHFGNIRDVSSVGEVWGSQRMRDLAFAFFNRFVYEQCQGCNRVVGPQFLHSMFGGARKVQLPILPI